jgi:RNA polymerase sigma-70 factor (ECF subfamily)
MNHATEEQIESLAGKIKRSDKRAYDDFFRLMYPHLTGFAITYVREKSMACDIVQDAFVILWQKRFGIDTGKSLKSYMYQMVRNRCLNELRNRSKEVVSSELAENNTIIEMEIENQNNDRNSLGSLFREWINALPERQKEAFELSRFEGMDHDEIAGLMNISPKTVNNHIVAAMTQLRKYYKQYKQKNSIPDE